MLVVSRTTASAMRIDREVEAIGTLSFAAAGDRGGQTYIRVKVGSIGAFQSADGAWWRPVGHPLRPEQFGARGDGSGDDSAAINEMIRLAASWQQGHGETGVSVTKMLLSGSYRISSPIQLWNEQDGAIRYGTFCLEGETASYALARAPEIVADYFDRPIIAMHGMRMTELKNFTCRRVAQTRIPTPRELMNERSEGPKPPWWNPTGNLVDLQYSMSAGVAIDPFSSAPPPDGGYRGWSRYYSDDAGSGAKSSLISFEGIHVHDNVVGVAIGCAHDGNLVDNITFDHCLLGQNKVAIAIGTDQARGGCVRNCHIVGVETMFDGSTYGQKVGVMPTVIGGVLDICKWLVNFGNGASRGVGTMTGTYSEAIWSLGFWAGGFPLTLTSCHLKFCSSEENRCARVAHFVGQNLILSGGSWSFYRGRAEKCFIANAGPVRLDDCAFDDQPVFADPLSVDITRMPLYYVSYGRQFGVAMQQTALIANMTGPGMSACHTPTGATTTFVGPHSAVVFKNLVAPIQTPIETSSVSNNGDGTGEFRTKDAGAYRVGDYLCVAGQLHNVRTCDPSVR
ncbi:MAG: hypothetical protein C3F11_03405, partial [Methylocystaceae bacterium]